MVQGNPKKLELCLTQVLQTHGLGLKKQMREKILERLRILVRLITPNHQPGLNQLTKISNGPTFRLEVEDLEAILATISAY